MERCQSCTLSNGHKFCTRACLFRAPTSAKVTVHANISKNINQSVRLLLVVDWSNRSKRTARKILQTRILVSWRFISAHKADCAPLLWLIPLTTLAPPLPAGGARGEYGNEPAAAAVAPPPLHNYCFRCVFAVFSLCAGSLQTIRASRHTPTLPKVTSPPADAPVRPSVVIWAQQVRRKTRPGNLGSTGEEETRPSSAGSGTGYRSSPDTDIYSDPGYMNIKIRKFRTDKFDKWIKRQFLLM